MHLDLLKTALESSILLQQKTQKFRLENGMEILIYPRPQTQVVSCMIWYHVGSAYETPGQTGISHFLEHLMFKGTLQYPKGEIDLLTQLYGGTNNACTHQDFTSYYFNFAADRYEIALEIEANRMQSCLFEEREFQAEKMVVIDELMQGQDSPWNVLDEELYLLSYQVHPYRRPIIGWKADLMKMTKEQVESYYRRYYCPNNATLVLVGDLDVEKALAKIKTLFAPIPAVPLPRYLPHREPQQRGERRAILSLDVQISRLSMAFHTCPMGHPDDYTLDLLDHLLSSGKSSRLHQKLVEQEKLCRFIATHNESNKFAGMYWISAELLENDSAEVLERLILKEIERLKEEEISEEEMEKAKNIALAQHLFSEESCESLAYALGMWENACSYTYYEGYLEAIQKITPAQLRASVQRYFHSNYKNVVLVRPHEDPSFSEEAEEPEFEIPSEEALPASSLASLTSPHFSFSLPSSKKGKEPRLEYRREVLENGLVLVHHYKPSLPLVHLQCFVDAGQRYESPEQAGIAYFTGSMLTQGTENYTAVALAQAIESVGGLLDATSTGVACKVLRPHLNLALTLVSECLQRPLFPIEEFQKERTKLYAEIQNIQENPRRCLSQEFYRLVYENHPFARPALGSIETLKKLNTAGSPKISPLFIFPRPHYFSRFWRYSF
jgi:zinc protease